MSIISLVAVTAVLSVILIAVFTRLVHKYPRRHPPGPKGLPVLGNILDIPKEDAWRTYAEWSRQFGEGILFFAISGWGHGVNGWI